MTGDLLWRDGRNEWKDNVRQLSYILKGLTKRYVRRIIINTLVYYKVISIWFDSMMRRSKQREAILKIVRSTSSHPMADWVYEQVKKEIPNISFGTVYRNLKLLKDRGEILELDLGHGPSHYNGTVSNHYHFRCEECGRIFDLEEPIDPSINERVARHTGHTITHHVLEFRGTCRDCRK